jgi:dihydrodipicolinate synthase/N-acetylneuraminate lyase
VSVRIVCPLATPLRDGEELDVPALRRLVEHLVPEVDAFFLLGSSGESATLRDRVRTELVDRAAGFVAGRRPVWVGIGEAGTERAIDNARRYAGFGADAFVACAPYYFGAATQAELSLHHQRIADAVSAPLFLYNIPQLTGLALDARTVAPLSVHPNVVGIKDSSGDFIAFQEHLALRSDGFAVYQGREDLAAVSMWLGGAGIVSALANVGPRLLRALLDAVAAGDDAATFRLQRDVTRASRVFYVTHPVAALKLALAAQGYIKPLTAAPMHGYDRQTAARVRALLDESGLLKPADAAPPQKRR